MLLTVILLLGVDNASIDIYIAVNFTITAREFTEDCARGLTDPGFIYLQYRGVELKSSRFRGPWNLLDTLNLSSSNVDILHRYSQQHKLENAMNFSHLQFRLIQLEHGGGYCNCWGVVDQSWTVSIFERPGE